MISYSPKSNYVDFIWTHPADIDGNLMETCDSVMAVYSPATTKLTDDCWLFQWSEILQKALLAPKIPLEATGIHIPLVPAHWQQALRNYNLYKPLAEFFLQGITKGFRIGYDYDNGTLKSVHKNLSRDTEVVDDYLQTELVHHCIAGPFRRENLPGIQINRFGVIPKGRQQNKLRLIADLSFPKDYSVNDGVPKPLYSLSFITIDGAIDGTCTKLLFWSRHASSQARYQECVPLTTCASSGQTPIGNALVYIDTCLPLGLRSAPKLFSLLADFLSWIIKERGVSFTIHYLNDFLTIGPGILSLSAQFGYIYRSL